MKPVITLRELTATAADEAAFFEGKSLWRDDELSWYTFSWKPEMPYAEMLEILRKEKAGVDLQPGRVPHTMLYAFNAEQEIVGRVSIRHELNDHLRKRGGHIGYAVAEKFRKLGYASEMFRQGEAYCRSLGLSEIMITCADNNVASPKIIENAGGVLKEKSGMTSTKKTRASIG